MSKKTLTIFYKTIISVSIFLLSIYAFSIFDILHVMMGIQEGNVNANIAFYAFILSGIKEYIEETVKENKVRLEVIMSTHKHDSQDTPRTMTLRGDTPKTFYLVINTVGKITRLKGRALTIVFPKGVTVSRQDNVGLANQKENEIVIELSEIDDLPGKTVIPINILRGSVKTEQVKNVICKLDSNKADALLVEFSSNTMGIEMQD